MGSMRFLMSLTFALLLSLPSGGADPKAGDASDVEALLPFGHGASENDVVDRIGGDSGRAPQRLGDGRGRELVGPRPTQDSIGRFADGRPDGGYDDSVSCHGFQSPSKSSSASPTSLTFPSNR